MEDSAASGRVREPTLGTRQRIGFKVLSKNMTFIRLEKTPLIRIDLTDFPRSPSGPIGEGISMVKSV